MSTKQCGSPVICTNIDRSIVIDWEMGNTAVGFNFLTWMVTTLICLRLCAGWVEVVRDPARQTER